jgi:hypothetical protein
MSNAGAEDLLLSEDRLVALVVSREPVVAAIGGRGWSGRGKRKRDDEHGDGGGFHARRVGARYLGGERGVAQFGSAFGWGPKGRWFKSSRPDRRKARSTSGLSAQREIAQPTSRAVVVALA